MLFKLRKFLKPYKKQLFLGPLAKLTEAVFELILPLLMAGLIDIGVKNNDMDYVIQMSIYMAIVSAIGLICALFCQYSASVASQGFGTALREALMEKINSMSHFEIDKFGTSTIINRSTVDVNQLQLAVAMLIRLVIRAPFLCIGGVIMAMRIDLRLSLILIIFIPIFIFVLYNVMKKTIPLYKSVQKKLDRLSAALRENLTGIRVVRVFANSKEEIKRFETANAEWMETSLRAGKISALLSPATLLIMNTATLFIIWFGGVRVGAGGLKQGQLIAFISYITQIMLALIVVSNLTVIFTRASAAASRINEIFETEPVIKIDATIPAKKIEKAPSIEFRNVSFKYGHNNEYVLKNISFKVIGGDTVGVIGGTGSGKSTLINLIPRFYDVSAGEILIGGVDVKQFNLKSLRDDIGIVPQKAALFSGTIRSNICLGKKDATEQEIEYASKSSQAYEFIERMPQKYETIVSQGGKNLSGGQKQRLTIARALVRAPKILILDDSASALDYATDAALRKSLKENSYGTTFIVSQRVNAIRNADFIIVLDDGELHGVGKHDALFKNNALYKEICKSQNVDGGSSE